MMRWTVWDHVRTLLDFSAAQGVLEKQDDFGFTPNDLPYRRMLRRATVLGLKVHDFRQIPRAEKHKRGRAKGTRNIRNIDTVLFHQMAAVIHDPRRCLSIPAHGAIVRGGDIVLLHPIRAYLYHAHAANPFSVGIEIAARAAGIDGRADTFWLSKKEKKMGLKYDDLGHEATPRQLEAANILADYYVEEIDRRMGSVEYVMDHRNSDKSRNSDPGSRIHKYVTLATRERLKLRHRDPVGTGQPNPHAWSGDPNVPYSWRVAALGGKR